MRRHALLGVLLILLGLVAADSAAALSAQEERGKQIFYTGRGPAGRQIIAYVGRARAPVPAAVVNCVGCHGEDGLGRPERGVFPPNITWANLTKTYGHVHDNGRRHPAFDEDSLGRAITQGIDPAGNALDSAMPRFEMDAADLADLVAYLKQLGVALAPGIDGDRIKLGTVVPTSGRQAPLGQAVRALLEAYFSELNSAGGIYGRRLELAVAEAVDNPEKTLANALRLIEEDEVFALIAAFAAGLEEPLGALVEAEEVPLLGPLTLFPAQSAGLDRFVFFLLPGLQEQARALLEHAARSFLLTDPALAVVHPGGAGYEPLVEAVATQGRRHGWTRITNVDAGRERLRVDGLVHRLRELDTRIVLFFGSARELAALAAEASQQDWYPYLLMPGSQAGPELLTLPNGFEGRVFLAYPSLPSDHPSTATREFVALHRKHALGRESMGMQISAYAAARVLVEGLKRAGKELTRDKLVAALEGLHAFETGVTPAISYGPNRRIGALGAYIVMLDLARRTFKPVGGWIALDE